MDDQKNIKPDFSKAGEDSILYKKEEPKTEREKLKELHGKDKIWYLVHYYGLQTIVALAIIGTISFLIIHYVTQKDTALEIMAVNAIQSADNPAGDSGYYNDFLKENGLDPDKSEVLVSSNLGASANENDGASAASIQMIQSCFMTQSVDVFFPIMISFIHWENSIILRIYGNVFQKMYWKIQRRYCVCEKYGDRKKISDWHKTKRQCVGGKNRLVSGYLCGRSGSRFKKQGSGSEIYRRKHTGGLT